MSAAIQLSPFCTGTVVYDRPPYVRHDDLLCPIHEAQTPEGRWDRVPSKLVLIHTAKRKTGLSAGTVERDGYIIGRAFRCSRVAAGAKGKHRPFYTAVVCPDGGESLGTRFPTRSAAVAALTAFDRSYPPAKIAHMARTIAVPRWSDGSAESMLRAARHAAILSFKADYDRGF